MANWRRLPSAWANPVQWIFWAILIYALVTISSLLGDFGFLAFPLAIGGALATIWIGYWLGLTIIASLAPRVWRAVEVEPPPQSPDPPSLVFSTPPPARYPALALARGQCGWVHLALRASPGGRVTHYCILNQAPSSTFGSAVARALDSARLPPAPEARELTTLITFVTPDDAAPSWARDRLAAQQAD